MQGDFTYEIGCVILGVVVILIGRFINDKVLLPKRKKYKERDPKRYIKSCRKALYFLGGYYILLGIVPILAANEPSFLMAYSFSMPILSFLPLVVIIKKYT